MRTPVTAAELTKRLPFGPWQDAGPERFTVSMPLAPGASHSLVVYRSPRHGDWCWMWEGATLARNFGSWKELRGQLSHLL